MKTRILRPPLMGLAAAAVLTAFHASAAADERATEAKPLELRKIMQELGKGMQSVTDAISREDWALVASLAPRIADHRKPPIGERTRIMAFIGTDLPRFKGFDDKTQDAAQALQQAASQGDGAKVISAFADLQNACLGCHQNFRKRVVEHFYDKR